MLLTAYFVLLLLVMLLHTLLAYMNVRYTNCSLACLPFGFVPLWSHDVCVLSEPATAAASKKKPHSAKTDGLRTTDDDVFVCWPSFGMFLLFGFSSICCLHLCFGERDRDRLCSFLFKHIVLFISSSSSAFSSGFS